MPIDNFSKLFQQAITVSEKAAIACAPLRGKGDNHAADQAAVEAMRSALNTLNIRGEVVIGEGERDEAPMLYIGEKVGTGEGLEVDIALDPLEGTTLCAHYKNNALAVIAFAQKGHFLNAPDVYMDKIAIGGGYPDNIVDIDASVRDNIQALAQYKKCSISAIRVCVLKRERHGKLIEDLRQVGATVCLIEDGDIAGVVHTISPEKSGIDVYMGIGGAPEGVLAAAAMVCQQGQMQARLITDKQEQKERASAMGRKDFDKKLFLSDLARGEIIFCATGVTDGTLLKGVISESNQIKTHSLILSSHPKLAREITTVAYG